MSEEVTVTDSGGQAMLDELAALINTKPAHEEGKIILVYSQAGVGKTSTFCQFKDGILIQEKDESAGALKHSGSIREDYPVITTTGYHHAIEVTRKVTASGKYRHVTHDGGSGMHEWSDEIARVDDFEGDRVAFGAFGRGDRSAGFLWEQYIEALREARAAGVWSYVLAHKEIITEKNASGSDYLKSAPAMSKNKRAQLLRYADAVLFMDFKTETVNVNKQSNVGKAMGGEIRVMYCTPSASYEAKNRLGLPDEILLGDSPQEAYRALGAALKAGKKKQGENQ